MPLSDVNGSPPDAEKDARLKQYKNQGKHEEIRRKRTECSVEIRKQKGEDLLMKKRNLPIEEKGAANGDMPENKKADNSVPHMSNAQIIAVLKNNPSVEQMRFAFEALRTSLVSSKTPPVDEVIKCGLLQALAEALTVEDERVQFEATWSLTNIVSGTTTQTMAAVEAGICAPLVKICRISSAPLAEQALWALANICGDSPQLRDYVIECNGVELFCQLVDQVDKMRRPSFAVMLAWAFSNMCRYKNPHASLEVLSMLSKGLTKLLTYPDPRVCHDACWAVFYLTDGPDEQKALVLENGMLPHIIKFLKAEEDKMVVPALRVLGNMATGNEELTQAVIDMGTLAELYPITQRSTSTSVVKQCCWLISNIVAGTQRQKQAVLDAGLLPLLVKVVRSGASKCQFEACWAIANLCQGGTREQIVSLVDERAVTPLCSLLNHKNFDTQTNAMESLYAILSTVSTAYPQRLDEVRDSIEECGGLQKLERLRESQSQKVCEKAYRIIAEFFDQGTDEEIAQYNF